MWCSPSSWVAADNIEHTGGVLVESEPLQKIYIFSLCYHRVRLELARGLSAVADMWRWFTYDDDDAESDGAEEETKGGPSQQEREKGSPKEGGDSDGQNKV